MRDQIAELLPRMLRFARRLTRDRQLAEDLVQEVVVRALQREESLRQADSLLPWLLKITANVFRDHLRKRMAMAVDTEMLEAAESQFNSVERIEVEDEVAKVMRMMDGLPARQRQVLYLNACEGYSPSEIAEILEMEMGAVRVNLCHARRRMREEYESGMRVPVVETGRGGQEMRGEVER